MKTTLIIIYTLVLSTIFVSCSKDNVDLLPASQETSSTRFKAPAVLTINVPLGGNIQNAIDQVAADGGGTVNLATGTYTLNSTLFIKSNVLLNGAGNPATTIKASGAFNVIENATEGMKNVTIRNLKVQGVSSQYCYGILIQATTTYHDTISVSNVQVTGAGMGVHCKRVKNLSISDCNIHHNGAANQLYYFHNLYIRSCETVTVSNSHLDYSTSANGFNVSYCTNVTVSNCTANNNYFRGMRAADTDGFSVQSCTISSNGDIGLLANAEITATKNINWNNCTVTSNIKGGIKAISGVTGSVTNCTATGNLIFNYSLPATVSKSNNN